MRITAWTKKRRLRVSKEAAIQDNLAEHILMLWQTEDLLRALSLDVEKVKKHLFNTEEAVDENPELRKNLHMYQVLIQEMRQEGVEETGHLRRTLLLMSDLESMHKILTEEVKDAEYLALKVEAEKMVGEFIKNKSKRSSMLFTEACLNAMYGILVLRLKGEKITPATQEAIEPMKAVLRYLSKKYLEYKDN